GGESRIEGARLDVATRFHERAHLPLRAARECERAHVANAAPASATMRCTPSVTCVHESVAPLMFWMSSPTFSGADGPFPTNCARQAAWRISWPWLSRYARISTCFT